MTKVNIPLMGQWKLHIMCEGWRFWFWRIYISRNTLLMSEWVTRDALDVLLSRMLNLDED